jgi:hypothetical protein
MKLSEMAPAVAAVATIGLAAAPDPVDAAVGSWGYPCCACDGAVEEFEESIFPHALRFVFYDMREEFAAGMTEEASDFAHLVNPDYVLDWDPTEVLQYQSCVNDYCRNRDISAFADGFVGYMKEASTPVVLGDRGAYFERVIADEDRLPEDFVWEFSEDVSFYASYDLRNYLASKTNYMLEKEVCYDELSDDVFRVSRELGAQVTRMDVLFGNYPE